MCIEKCMYNILKNKKYMIDVLWMQIKIICIRVVNIKNYKLLSS